MLNYCPTIPLIFLCCRLNGIIFTFSLTVSDAMAAAHSGLTLVTCGVMPFSDAMAAAHSGLTLVTCVTCVTCCLCSCERVPAGPDLSAATDPRAQGPSWIKSLSRLLSLQDVLELDVQTFLNISSREVLHKFLCLERETLP